MAPERVLGKTLDCFVVVHAGGGLESYGGSVDEVLSFFSSEIPNLASYSAGVTEAELGFVLPNPIKNA